MIAAIPFSIKENSKMQEKIELLLGNAANGKEALIALLLDNAKAFAVSYCRLGEYKADLDAAVTRMVLEDFNRLGGEGTAAQSFNGISESYNEDYSQQVYKLLNRNRKLKTL